MNLKYRLIELFKRHPHFFWSYISYQYSLDFHMIKFLEEKLIWWILPSNPNIFFTMDLIKKYKRRWDKYSLVRNPAIKANPEIWEYMRLYKLKKENIEWYNCDEESMKKRFAEIEDQRKNDWPPYDNERYRTSGTEYDFKTLSFSEIDKLKDKLNWKHFSANTDVQWSYELLYRYKDYWYFNDNVSPCDTHSSCGLELYRNNYIPWDIDIIELFEDKLFKCDRDTEFFIMGKTVSNYLNQYMSETIFTDVVCHLFNKRTSLFINSLELLRLGDELRSKLDPTKLYFNSFVFSFELKCSICSNHQFFSNYSSFSGYKRIYISEYQCQSCGELITSPKELNLGTYTWVYDKPCSCGGEFRRDKPLFCPICKDNSKTYEHSNVIVK